ncbi:hypothetical protein OTU49_005534 [Cherax quadricarinatus]|uniref:Uncharacterized protein n=1 Tax=Cherax quadricarinatus TaxID=27406 RepID=A0AAW0YL37_CHEQU
MSSRSGGEPDITLNHHCEKLAVMPKNILNQVVTEIKACSFFVFYLDESTDVAFCTQLLVYTRYLKRNSMKWEYLFSKPLITIAYEVVLMTFQNSISDNEWSK